MSGMQPDVDVRRSITVRLREALREFSNDPSVEEIADDTPLTDVLESLGHFTFLLSLEETFQLEVPDHKFTFAEMGTLAGIINVLCECSERARKS